MSKDWKDDLEKILDVLEVGARVFNIHVFSSGQFRTDAISSPQNWRSASTSRSFRKSATQAVARQIRTMLGKRDFVDITRVGNPTNRVVAAVNCRSDVREARLFAHWLQSVPDGTSDLRLKGRDLKGRDKAFFEKCTFYACDFNVDVPDVSLGGKEPCRVLTFHKVNPKISFGRKLFAIFDMTNDQFSEVEAPLFEFNLSPDFIWANDVGHIFNFENFITITGIRGIQIEQAKNGIVELENRGVVQFRNRDALHISIENKRTTNRQISNEVSRAIDHIGSVVDKDMSKNVKKRMAKVVKTLGLNVEISVVDGEITFIVDGDDYNSAIQFLHLLNDDYLRSPISLDYFLSHSKIIISAKTPHLGSSS